MQEVVKKETTFDLVIQSQLLVAEILEADGELSPELEKKINDLVDRGSNKVDACIYFTEIADTQVEFLKDKAAAFRKKAATIQNSIDIVRDKVKLLMRHLNLPKIAGNDFVYTLRNSAKTLSIEQANLDPDYFMTVTIREPDKERIRAALEQGIEVRGAKLEQGKTLAKQINKGGK